MKLNDSKFFPDSEKIHYFCLLFISLRPSVNFGLPKQAPASTLLFSLLFSFLFISHCLPWDSSIVLRNITTSTITYIPIIFSLRKYRKKSELNELKYSRPSGCSSVTRGFSETPASTSIARFRIFSVRKSSNLVN